MNNLYEKIIKEEKINNQGCLMKIIEYNNASDIVVEFQDDYKAKVHSIYQHFANGSVKNPYYLSVYGVGITGNKYPININGEQAKEYVTWLHMIRRCFSHKEKNRITAYKNVTCCNEWILYENFYEWLHGQENFIKWLNGDRWCIDKDILIKGNKVYSPETCCLVPNNVNNLILKHEAGRGELPIGMTKHNNKIQVWCSNPFTGKCEPLGTYSTKEEAFSIYKSYKEDIIKRVANIEYSNGNITKKCYESLISYQIEIDD